MRAFSGRADELQRRRGELEARSAEVADFLGRFQLRDDEAEALRAGSLDAPESARAFFAALARVQVRPRLVVSPSRDARAGLVSRRARARDARVVCPSRSRRGGLSFAPSLPGGVASLVAFL